MTYDTLKTKFETTAVQYSNYLRIRNKQRRTQDFGSGGGKVSQNFQ